MIKIPEWRDPPEPVWVSCQKVKALPGDDKEFLVRFEVNGEEHLAIVYKQHVNPDEKLMRGVIVAEYEGDLLVDIPSDSFNAGSRILVPKSEIKTLLKPA